jgi:hypothetical protein
MKNLFNLSLILFLTLSTFVAASAQKTLSDGTITYDLKLDKDNPMAGMLNGTNMVLSFKGSLMKTSVNVMGGMMSMNVVMDNTAKKGIMLVSAPMMGKNMAVEMTEKDFADAENKQKENQSKAKISYNKKSQKKIAGYKCYQATAKIDGMPEGIVLYLTDKIKPMGQSQIQNQIPGLTGFPLAFEVNQAGMKILFEASKIDKIAPTDKEFDMTIPEGFEKVTMEEIQGMGGLGFGM